MRALGRALAVTVAAGLTLTACGAAVTEPQQVREADVPRPVKSPEPVAAAAKGSLGGPGTACALPVSFGLAAAWKPEAVEVGDDELSAALGRQGPATMVCEIDAKPAGNIGFLRVWSAGKGKPRTVLEGFVRAEENASGAAYKETRAGELAAVEVTYTVRGELMDESKEERAFAVSTPKGTVIVHLGGMDTEEHREMLPAYELARTSLKAL